MENESCRKGKEQGEEKRRRLERKEFVRGIRWLEGNEYDNKKEKTQKKTSERYMETWETDKRLRNWQEILCKGGEGAGGSRRGAA